LNELKLKCLNTTRFFIEKDLLCIVEKYLPYTLDAMVDESDGDKDIYLLALEITKGIEELHKN